MNVYIWKRVEHVSGHYHHEGGLVVISNSLEEARACYVRDGPGHKPEEVRKPYDFQPEKCTALTTEPDLTIPVEYEGAEYMIAEQVIVFPDAGCCSEGPI